MIVLRVTGEPTTTYGASVKKSIRYYEVGRIIKYGNTIATTGPDALEVKLRISHNVSIPVFLLTVQVISDSRYSTGYSDWLAGDVVEPEGLDLKRAPNKYLSKDS